MPAIEEGSEEGVRRWEDRNGEQNFDNLRGPKLKQIVWIEEEQKRKGNKPLDFSVLGSSIFVPSLIRLAPL